jgi:hypothetical protein
MSKIRGSHGDARDGPPPARGADRGASNDDAALLVAERHLHEALRRMIAIAEGPVPHIVAAQVHEEPGMRAARCRLDKAWAVLRRTPASSSAGLRAKLSGRRALEEWFGLENEHVISFSSELCEEVRAWLDAEDGDRPPAGHGRVASVGRTLRIPFQRLLSWPIP